MELKEIFDTKSQELSAKKEAEVRKQEEKKLLVIHKKIDNLGGKKNKLVTSYDNLQELSDLQPNEVNDFRKTQEIVDKVLKEHKDVAEKEGLKTTKDVVSAHPNIEQSKDYKQAHKKLKTTAKKILKERGNLKKQDVKEVRGKDYGLKVKEKIRGFDKEIKDLKLQTPEGQEERKQEFKNKIKGYLKERRWDDSLIGNTDFVEEKYLNEAKNYGEEGEQIIKQTISEHFQEENFEIASLRKIDQELGLLESFENGYRNLDSKVEELKNLKKNLPNILAEEIEKNSGLKKACWRYFESPNADYILKHSFFSNYLLEDIDEWFSRTEDLCQEGKEMVSSDYSHLKDKVINAIDLNKDTERMLNLFTDLKKNITKELSNYIKSEKGKTEKSIELESIFLKPKADYLFKPQEEVKEILRKKDLNEAKRELEEKIEGISIKVSSKIDLDWLEVEKGLFEKKNKTRAIENKKRNIEERKEKAEKSLGNLDEVEKNLNEYLGEVIKIDDVEESFRSPELKDSINQTDKQIKEIKNKIDDNSKQIGEKDRQSRKVSKGRWQVGMDNLKSEKKKLDEGLERLQKDREEQVDRWSQLNDLSKILRDFDLSQEFNGKELTIGSTLKILRDKLTVIQSKEGLFSEEQAIYQNWQGLEAQIKEAEDKYSESKKEFPNF